MNTMEATKTYHEGKVSMRTVGNLVIVLCPYGHVVTGCRTKDFAGSALEARLGSGEWVVRCEGTVRS